MANYFTDRVVQYPGRVVMNPVSGEANTYDMSRAEGTVTEEGTPFNAEAFNAIANRIHAYGTCSTGASTAAKVVTCPGFVLEEGATITVYFTNAQTSTSSCTLNVNGGNEIKNVAPYDWIYQNCHKYGFVVRYPADKAAITGVGNYEECFRYVGAAHAYVMKTNHMCLEEYLTSLRSYTKDAPLSVTTEDNATYEIYYVAAVGTETPVPVPTDATYTVSGDNEGGFIVTVKRS